MDQNGVLLKNVTLKTTVTSAELDGLRPGTRYTVTVVTEAVDLQSSSSKQAITGTYYGMFSKLHTSAASSAFSSHLDDSSNIWKTMDVTRSTSREQWFWAVKPDSWLPW